MDVEKLFSIYYTKIFCPACFQSHLSDLALHFFSIPLNTKNRQFHGSLVQEFLKKKGKKKSIQKTTKRWEPTDFRVWTISLFSSIFSKYLHIFHWNSMENSPNFRFLCKGPNCFCVNETKREICKRQKGIQDIIGLLRLKKISPETVGTFVLNIICTRYEFINYLGKMKHTNSSGDLNKNMNVSLRTVRSPTIEEIRGKGVRIGV